MNENHPLHNQILHISDTFKEPEKVNIENKKVNIEEDFTAKTASHVRKLQEDLGKEIVFGRSDVQRVLDLKPKDALPCCVKWQSTGSLSL